MSCLYSHMAIEIFDKKVLKYHPSVIGWKLHSDLRGVNSVAQFSLSYSNCRNIGTCYFFDPSAEYLLFLMLRYAIMSLLLLRLLKRDHN